MSISKLSSRINGKAEHSNKTTTNRSHRLHNEKMQRLGQQHLEIDTRGGPALLSPWVSELSCYHLILFAPRSQTTVLWQARAKREPNQTARVRMPTSKGTG